MSVTSGDVVAVSF